MEILKTIVVLVFLMTAVLNQDLVTNHTEFWSQLTPIVYSNNNNTIEFVGNEISCDLPEDILRNLITKTARNLGADELTFHKTSIHNNKYSGNDFFTDCYFYDQQTKIVYTWDITYDCFLTINTTETKQYNGSNATMLKFERIADLTFISPLIDNNKDIWSTNMSILFVTNKQPPLCMKRNTELFSIAQKQPDSGNDKIKDCDTGLLKIEISASVLAIVIIVVIVCMCTLRKKCMKHPKQRLRISYWKKITEHAWYQYEAFKRPICVKESDYEEVIEIHQYEVIGNGDKIVFDDIGNKLERETPIYECPYTMNKSLVPVNEESKQSDANDVAHAEIYWKK